MSDDHKKQMFKEPCLSPSWGTRSQLTQVMAQEDFI